MMWVLASYLMATFLSISAAFASPDAPAPGGNDTVYVQLLEPWRSPPPEIENRRRSALARVILIRGQGVVVEHYCYLIEAGDRWAVSAGDGHVVAIGSGQASQSGLLVRRQAVYRTVRILPPATDPLCDTPTYTIRANGEDILVDGHAAQRTSKIPLDTLRSYVHDVEREGTKCGG